jgi:hypothetical protein
MEKEKKTEIGQKSLFPTSGNCTAMTKQKNMVCETSSIHYNAELFKYP